MKRILSHQQRCAKMSRSTYEGPTWPVVLSRSISEGRPWETGSSTGEASAEGRVSVLTGPILKSASLQAWVIGVQQEVDSMGKKPAEELQRKQVHSIVQYSWWSHKLTFQSLYTEGL